MHITTSRVTQIPLNSGTVLSNCVCNAFNVALLLTGSMTGAEEAVLEAVEALDPKDLTPSTLLCRTIESSIRYLQVHGTNGTIDLGLGSLKLPMELRKVLKMDVGLRQSFVLRMLVGLSADDCGRLLGWDRSLVDAGTCAALTWLANEKMTEDIVGVSWLAAVRS
jgi:hypothetical protein